MAGIDRSRRSARRASSTSSQRVALGDQQQEQRAARRVLPPGVAPARQHEGQRQQREAAQQPFGEAAFAVAVAPHRSCALAAGRSGWARSEGSVRDGKRGTTGMADSGVGQRERQPARWTGRRERDARQHVHDVMAAEHRRRGQHQRVERDRRPAPSACATAHAPAAPPSPRAARASRSGPAWTAAPACAAGRRAAPRNAIGPRAASGRARTEVLEGARRRDQARTAGSPPASPRRIAP